VVVVQWQVQEAKQRFSEVLRAAESGEPQIVTKHGEEVAVVIDIAEYRRLRGESMTFMEFLRAEPVADGDVDAETERAPDLPREVDLAG
jgi:prevent-host-death family protein